MTALYAIGAAIIALLAAWFGGRISGKSSEKSKQQAAKADAYENHLEEIADATNARNRIQPADSLHDDPYRRD